MLVQHSEKIGCSLLAILLIFAALSCEGCYNNSPSSRSMAQEVPRYVIPRPPEMTSIDLGAFFDGAVPLSIERSDIAGAVISVVKDGRLLFSRGYGYADVSKKIPVTPDGTLFRPDAADRWSPCRRRRAGRGGQIPPRLRA